MPESTMSEVSESPTTASQPKSWTRQDYLLVFIAVMIKLGDGVEVYLPGVITQTVACELGVSELQESILAVILYLFWAISVMSAVPIIKRFGERACLLLSLYLSIFFAILCALVPNYYTILLSRALTGICGGLNACTIGIYLAKHVSSKDVLTVGSFLSEGLAYPVGGAWVSVLGWLILEHTSWRVFVLLTSIPLFVPPIIMLHAFVTEKSEVRELESETSYSLTENNVVGTEHESLVTDNLEQESLVTNNLEHESLVTNKPANVKNFRARVFKSSLFFFCSICIGFGSIILLPWLIRSHKEENVDDDDEKCAQVVKGTDFLVLALITGVTNVVGRPIGYILWSRVRFLVLQSTLTGVMVLCYSIILFTPNLIAAEVLLAISKLCYSIQAIEIAILSYDYDYFGLTGLELGSSVSTAVGLIGGVVGSSLAAFLKSHIAIIVTLVIACVQFILVFFMKERH